MKDDAFDIGDDSQLTANEQHLVCLHPNPLGVGANRRRRFGRLYGLASCTLCSKAGRVNANSAHLCCALCSRRHAAYVDFERHVDIAPLRTRCFPLVPFALRAASD